MIAHGVFAYMRAYSEFIYHNTKEITQRLLFETMDEIERLPKMKQKNGDVVVDCNQFPGYDLFYQGLCFYLMLGNVLQSLLPSDYPKTDFSRYTTSRKVKELDNEVIISSFIETHSIGKKQTISYSNPILETSLGLTTLLG